MIHLVGCAENVSAENANTLNEYGIFVHGK